MDKECRKGGGSARLVCRRWRRERERESDRINVTDAVVRRVGAREDTNRLTGLAAILSRPIPLSLIAKGGGLSSPCDDVITVDYTPNYSVYPQLPYLAVRHSLCPDRLRVIMSVREPVARARSSWIYKVSGKRGKGELCFSESVRLNASQ